MTVSIPVLPSVPASHPENAWCLMSIDQAIALTKAGRLDPAILIWGFSPQAQLAIPSDLLAAANQNLPGLMEALGTNSAPRGQ